MRKPTRKRIQQQLPRIGHGTETRALILIDASEFRQKQWTSYQKLSKKLERETRLLRQFEHIDVDAFQLWIEIEFADDISALRTLSLRIDECLHLIRNVELLSARTGLSEADAYRDVKEAMEQGRLDELWQKLKKEAQRSRDPRAVRWHKLEDMIEEAFAAYEQSRDTFAKESMDFDTREGQQSSQATRDDDNYLKHLYHQLVLRLHPDKNPNQSPDNEALFHEVQDAYKWRDMARLETLFRRLGGAEEVLFRMETATIGEIIDRRAAVEKRLSALRKKMKEAKKHPAWNFSKVKADPKTRKQLRRQVQAELSVDRDDSELRLQMLEERIEEWRSRLERGGPIHPRAGKRGKKGR